MASVRHSGMLSDEKLASIHSALEGLAAKKELRARSAYNIYCAEKAGKSQAGAAAGGKGKSLKDAAAAWKAMTTKQKEPYTKKANEEKATKAAAVKAFNDKFSQHFDSIQKHLAAEAEIKTEMKEKKVAEFKASRKAARGVAAKQKAARAADRKNRAEKAAQRAKRHLPTRAPPGARPAGRPPARTSQVAMPQPSAAETREIRNSEMMRGLDPITWEVRESTTRPGFFYWFNKMTKQALPSKPPSDTSAPPPKRRR